MAQEQLPHFGNYIQFKYGDKVSIGYDSFLKKYEITEWVHEDPKKDIETLIADAESYKATYESTLYTYARGREYPEIKEQLDMLFHDMTAGKGTKDGEWYKAVAKVKTDNPKPTE